MTNEPVTLAGKVGIYQASQGGSDAVALFEQNKRPIDGHILRKGELLTIFRDEARQDKLWQGRIDFDPKISAFFPKNVKDRAAFAQYLREERPATLVLPFVGTLTTRSVGDGPTTPYLLKSDAPAKFFMRKKNEIVTLEKGDLLTIFKDADRRDVLWEGEIDLDFESSKKPNRGYLAILEFQGGISPEVDESIKRLQEKMWGQPVFQSQHAGPFPFFGGIQKGVDPDQWGEMFAQELPAMLTKMPKP